MSTAIQRFRNLDFLTNKSPKTGRLITVVNWELYQSVDKNHQSYPQRTPNQPPTNNNDNNEIKEIIEKQTELKM